jgi:hypothetical protein
LPRQLVLLESAGTDINEPKAHVIKRFGKGIWLKGYAQTKAIIFHVANGTLTGKTPFELPDLNVEQYCQVLTTTNKIIYEFMSL